MSTGNEGTTSIIIIIFLYLLSYIKEITESENA